MIDTAHKKLFIVFIHALGTSGQSLWIDASMKFLVIGFCSDPSRTSSRATSPETHTHVVLFCQKDTDRSVELM